jgi:putative two-component system response regulator
LKGEQALLEPGGRILAVDDQEQNLELVQELLSAAGYEVSLARDGEQALAQVERELPDCIILDIMMPRLDGYETCRRLKASPRTRFIPVVMLTALAEVSDKIKGLEVGADDFLNKPVRREELLARIRSLIKIKRLRDELDTSENIIYAMVQALESKDPLSAGHSERVAASSLATAVVLGLGSRDFEAVGKGGLLHDIGKLGVPEEVLESVRPLSPEYEALYRQHPEMGERILSSLNSLAPCLDVVRHHHERLDGSGYPDGIAGAELQPAAEIVAIANLYQDLLHREARSAAEAAAQLRQLAAQGGFHREMVEPFLRSGVAALGSSTPIADPWRDLAPQMPDVTAGRILICDDTPANRDMLHELLDDAGFRVSCVDGGAAVLPALSEEKPDLVLLDIRMPGLGGFEVCEWIKRNPETEFLPVVLVTAFSEVRDRLRSAQVGADDYIALPVNRLELVARTKSLLRLRMYYRDLEEHQSVLLSLASIIEAKDPYTRGHSVRVGELAARLAEEMGLPPEDCERMKVAGLLHDIGKIGVPERVINKPGHLTADEFDTIMTHPASGERICRPLRTVHNVLPMIRFHHERYDGHGYPDHLKGEQIPLGARILSLADAFDALTSDRSYRKRLPPPAALEILARETVEGHWDPAIYSALAAMIRKGDVWG